MIGGPRDPRVPARAIGKSEVGVQGGVEGGNAGDDIYRRKERAALRSNEGGRAGRGK